MPTFCSGPTPLSSTICRRKLNSGSDSAGSVELISLPARHPSHTVRSHRAILASALKAKGLSHEAIAKAMGWKAPGTAGHKLRGRNKWGPGELERMCELAGMTIVMLAEQSDDLVLTKRPEAVEAAAIVDEMTDAELVLFMANIRAYRDKRPDR